MNWNDDRELLRRLRDLPPPPIPPGLEARLLADVPAPGPPRRWWPVLASGAVAAGVALAVVTRPRPEPDPPPAQVLTLTRDVHPAFVQQAPSGYKETRPCDILPPLPQPLPRPLPRPL
jgi:hypothetical protein